MSICDPGSEASPVIMPSANEHAARQLLPTKSASSTEKSTVEKSRTATARNKIAGSETSPQKAPSEPMTAGCIKDVFSLPDGMKHR